MRETILQCGHFAITPWISKQYIRMNGLSVCLNDFNQEKNCCDWYQMIKPLFRAALLLWVRENQLLRKAHFHISFQVAFFPYSKIPVR